MAAIHEAMRRRGNLGGSAAGIPGGAQAANQNRPSNPIATGGMTPNKSAPQGAMPTAPTAENPLAGAQQMLGNSKPGEAELIIKSFADRLKKLPTGAEGLMMPGM